MSMLEWLSSVKMCTACEAATKPDKSLLMHLRNEIRIANKKWCHTPIVFVGEQAEGGKRLKYRRTTEKMKFFFTNRAVWGGCGSNALSLSSGIVSALFLFVKGSWNQTLPKSLFFSLFSFLLSSSWISPKCFVIAQIPAFSGGILGHWLRLSHAPPCCNNAIGIPHWDKATVKRRSPTRARRALGFEPETFGSAVGRVSPELHWILPDGPRHARMQDWRLH